MLLGLAVGFAAAAGLDVVPGFSGTVVGVCLATSVVLWAVWAVRSGPSRPTAVAPPVTGARPPSAGPGPGPGPGPGGMFAGRALGDALAWAAAEHGLTTLYSVTVGEQEVGVLGSALPGGPLSFLVVTAVPGGWQGRVDALPAEVDLGTGAAIADDAFRAGDLAPDVLSRLLDDARRQDARPRVDGADLTAVIDRPRGLRPDVTVRVAADDEWVSATWWGTADGRLLFVDQRAEV
ncbi:hypothetical protein DMO24_13195 [Modestobacter versicolor]|uniref:Uncharacterized protein n=1 Tax=Modestobacter versicolor TaxID=429133 RepID=A0A323V8J2_9ACTN|nr:hypothetical protein DMO24_13195 [Modestobacter versicolor]